MLIERIATHREVVNISSKERILRDPGLFEIGGRIILQPGQRVVLPIAVFHRLIHSPFLQSGESYDRQHPPVPAVEEPVEAVTTEPLEAAATTKICVGCGVEFEPASQNQKYHSKECRKQSKTEGKKNE